MDNKLSYQAPEAKTLDVEFQSNVLSGEKIGASVHGYGNEEEI